MRKIETNLLAAIKAGQTYHCDNTAYEPVTGTVTLHDNLICRFEGHKPKFCLAGWNTPTTRSRINAIAREFGHPGIGQVRGLPRIGGVGGATVTSTEWF